MTDPAAGEVTTRVPMAGAVEVDAAVAAAKEACATWRTSSPAHRIAILFRCRPLLDAHRDDIAALITPEPGKVHADALAEVARGLEIVELACGLGTALKGGHVDRGVEQRRRGIDPPVARCGRRHLTVRLPRNDRHVDVPHGDRLREHLRAQAEQQGPVRVRGPGVPGADSREP
nr:aldehyde dehydrogenase family protein [Streptomyces shenzhenensis]